ncbi:MAG: TonB-dependent receptor [Acidobacteria bacterium]|nr:TonB-dependent receptor [Acidobacteriota bacterium]
MRRIFIAVISLVLVLSLAANTLAQLGTASISGQVLDPQGAAVAKARVTLKNKSTGQSREVQTDDEGNYRMQNLLPAAYEVRVEAQGFAAAVVESVTLAVGQVPTVNVSLKPAGTSEVVQVTSNEAEGVDTTSSQVSGSISDRTLQSLPLNGRNFLDLAFLIPGNAPAPNYDPTKTTTIEISSAGQLGRGGNIAVDGADNNDDVVGGTLQNFPQDGIKEFQIVTNRFSAEIGRSASSAINIVTKTGGNQLHGSGAFFFRNDALSALPATLDRTVVQTLGRPPFDREQYAGSLGGPIKKDKAWWFVAAEYRNQDGVVLTGVRDFTARRVLTSFSGAPLNDFLLTGRADWANTANDNMAFRFSLQNEDDIDRGSLRRPIGTADNRQHSFNKYYSFLYNWVHTFSPKVLNDFIFHENKFKNAIPAFVSGRNELRFPSVQDGGNFRIPQRTRQNRIQLRDNLSWSAGTHSLKLGGEYQRLDTDAIFDLFGSGTLFLTQDFATTDTNGDGKIDDADIPVAVAIRSIAPNRPPTVPNVDNNFFAAYIQDDWKVSPRLTLNLGVRYELDTNTKNRSHFGDIFSIVRPFLASGSRKKDANNFAPRIGFNWDPWGDSKTSVRGGYGIYYDRIVLEVALLERLLDGRALPLEVRDGSNRASIARPFVGNIIPGAGAIGINIIDNNLDTPYVQQFSLGVQREIFHDLVVSVDGIHAFGSSFIIGRSIGTVFNPVINGTDSVVNIESSVKTWYDGLLVNVQKRVSNRFNFNASYTLAKSLNYSNDDQIPFQVGPLDPNNLRLEKGPSPNDERHRFSFAGVINAGRGIQVSPIYTLASGVPFDIILPNGTTRIPSIQRNAAGRLFHTGAELNSYIRQVNAGGGVGGTLLPLVNDKLRFGDSFTSFDLRVSKTWKLTEHLHLQGMAEAFNLFNVTNIRGSNNVNFSGFQNTLIPDSNDPTRSSSFGTPLQTAGGVFGTGGPRAFQFAAKVTF